MTRCSKHVAQSEIGMYHDNKSEPHKLNENNIFAGAKKVFVV
jgi:hypothetical protein